MSLARVCFVLLTFFAALNYLKAEPRGDLRHLPSAAPSLEAINESMDFGKECSSFVDKGTFRAWAKYIQRAFKNHDFEYLMHGPKDFFEYCPRYTFLPDQEKINVWIVVMNAMAHYESTCKVKAPAKGPNGDLTGLLQFHAKRERYYGSLCKNGDAKDPERTFVCGLSMLDEQIARDEVLFSRKSYWDVLRPQARSEKYLQIIDALRAYRLCQRYN